MPNTLVIARIKSQHLLIDLDRLILIPDGPEDIRIQHKRPHVGARIDISPETSDPLLKVLLPERPFSGSHTLLGILQCRFQTPLLLGQQHPGISAVLGYLQRAPGKHHPPAPARLHRIIRDLLRALKRGIRGGRGRPALFEHLLEVGVCLLK